MTTYIADSATAACDSLWSTPEGKPIDVPLKEQVTDLVLSFQSGELGGGKEMKYAGCTTSSAREAKPVTAKDIIEFEERRRKARMFRSKEGRVKRPIRRMAMS